MWDGQYSGPLSDEEERIYEESSICLPIITIPLLANPC